MTPRRTGLRPAGQKSGPELAMRKGGRLHDAALHATILGDDTRRVVWYKPATRIRITVTRP